MFVSGTVSIQNRVGVQRKHRYRVVYLLRDDGVSSMPKIAVLLDQQTLWRDPEHQSE